MDAVIILLCGVPGAGKTTLAKDLAALEWEDVTTGETTWRATKRVELERLTFDDLYTPRAIAFDPVQWKQTQEAMADIVRKRLMQHREENVCHVLLIDDNFYYRSMRKRFYHTAQEVDSGFGIVYVATPEETCRERNAARDDRTRVPEEQLERMIHAFEVPDRTFRFEHNVVVVGTIDAGCALTGHEVPPSCHHQEILRRVLDQASEDLVQRRSALEKHQVKLRQQTDDQKATAENLVHHFDLVSRKWISSVLKSEDPSFVITNSNEKAALAQLLNRQRKALLLDLRAKNAIIEKPKDAWQLLEHFRLNMIHNFAEL